MIDTIRHVAIVLIGAGVAVAGAYFKTCSESLFIIAGAIIGGEMGLSRTGPTHAIRVTDHPITVNEVKG